MPVRIVDGTVRVTGGTANNTTANTTTQVRSVRIVDNGNGSANGGGGGNSDSADAKSDGFDSVGDNPFGMFNWDANAKAVMKGYDSMSKGLDPTDNNPTLGNLKGWYNRNGYGDDVSFDNWFKGVANNFVSKNVWKPGENPFGQSDNSASNSNTNNANNEQPGDNYQPSTASLKGRAHIMREDEPTGTTDGTGTTGTITKTGGTTPTSDGTTPDSPGLSPARTVKIVDDNVPVRNVKILDDGPSDSTGDPFGQNPFGMFNTDSNANAIAKGLNALKDGGNLTDDNPVLENLKSWYNSNGYGDCVFRARVAPYSGAKWPPAPAEKRGQAEAYCMSD